jgi:hypothetical protein
MTTTVVRMGHDWSNLRLRDSEAWGEGVDVEAAAQAVIDRFHALAPAGITWIPATSELLIDQGADDTSDLEALLEQAYEDVWARIEDYAVEA